MQKDPLVSKVDKTGPQVGNEDFGIGKNSKRIELLPFVKINQVDALDG